MGEANVERSKRVKNHRGRTLFRRRFSRSDVESLIVLDLSGPALLIKQFRRRAVFFERFSVIGLKLLRQSSAEERSTIEEEGLRRFVRPE